MPGTTAESRAGHAGVSAVHLSRWSQGRVTVKVTVGPGREQKGAAAAVEKAQQPAKTSSALDDFAAAADLDDVI